MSKVKKYTSAFVVAVAGLGAATALVAPAGADAQCPASGAVSPAKPTFFDSNSNDINADTITIPASSCVHYTINGKRVAAGTHRVADYAQYATTATSNGWTMATATVQAEAETGYWISGYYWWQQGFVGAYSRNIPTPPTQVTAAAPQFNDKKFGKNAPGNDASYVTADSITIPASTGVVYTISGNKKTQQVAAGTYKVTDFANYDKYAEIKDTEGVYNPEGWWPVRNAEITVTAQVADANAYVLVGNTTWNNEFEGQTNGYLVPPVTASPTPTAPAPKPTTAAPAPQPTTTAPAPKPSTTAPAPKPTTAAPAPQPTTTAPAKKKASFVAPTFNRTNNTYTIPNAEGIQYYVGSTPVAAGTYNVTSWDANGNATITVKATVKAGYVSADGYASRTWSAGYIRTVQAQAPSFNVTGKKASDTFVIPSTTGVDYYANGKKVAAGTHKVADYATYTVTTRYGTFQISSATLVVEARAQQGYQVSGYYKWTQQFVASDSPNVIINPGGDTQNLIQVTPAAPKYTPGWSFWFINVPAKYTIPKVTGVDYYVNGTLTPAGTYKVASGTTVKIEAKPQAGYTFPYNTVTTNQWTYYSR